MYDMYICIYICRHHCIKRAKLILAFILTTMYNSAYMKNIVNDKQGYLIGLNPPPLDWPGRFIHHHHSLY